MKAKDLVRQLNSPSYKEREAATREIAKMGRYAVPALKDALANESSPEVRLRIDLVMPKAEAEDMKARVSCFLLDTEGKFDHQLPGWTKFKTVLGNDKSTRELFAEVLKNTTYHGLLLACDLPANELGGVLGGHYLAIQLQQQTGRGGPIKQPTTAEVLERRRDEPQDRSAPGRRHLLRGLARDTALHAEERGLGGLVVGLCGAKRGDRALHLGHGGRSRLFEGRLRHVDLAARRIARRPRAIAGRPHPCFRQHGELEIALRHEPLLCQHAVP